MHHLAGLCLKTDDSAGMVCLHLRLIQLDRPVLNRRGEREWLIELDHEIILEVTGNTARVLRGITDDFVPSGITFTYEPLSNASRMT